MFSKYEEVKGVTSGVREATIGIIAGIATLTIAIVFMVMMAIKK